MTAERKDELYDSMIGWICEHTDGGKELFHVLCEEFGMSQEELHDHCIESLDEFFTKEDIRTQFARKVQNCFAEYQASWKKLHPEELIEQAGEIHTIQQLRRSFPDRPRRKIWRIFCDSKTHWRSPLLHGATA